MACRSTQRAGEAKADIEVELQECRSKSLSSFPHSPHGKLVIIPLDLGDLSSVKTFVSQFKGQFNRLDVLVCNAGLSGVSGLGGRATHQCSPIPKTPVSCSGW